MNIHLGGKVKDIDAQVQALWDDGKTVAEIRDVLKINGVRCTGCLNRLQIPVEQRILRSNAKRYAPTPERDEEIYQEWLQGATYVQITQKHHISDHIIMRVLAEKGVTSEQKGKRRGRPGGPRVKRSKCCACGILVQHCDRLDEILCQTCPWAHWEWTGPSDGEHCCTKRGRKKGMMCSDCQEFLNVKPPDAGNQAVSEGGF